jgi:DNA-binding MarR family transcriptional regulator
VNAVKGGVTNMSLRRYTTAEAKSLLFQRMLIETQSFVNKNVILRDQILRLLKDETYSVAQIARFLGTNRQSIQKVANQLLAEKLCYRVENFYHRKSKLYKLTKRGGRHLLERAEEFDTFTNQMTYEVSLESLKTVIDVLETMNG